MGLGLLALKMGIYESDLKKLKQGEVSWGIASRLNMYKDDLQSFIDGKANDNLAFKIGAGETDLQILLDKAGKEGAIGIVFSMLIDQQYPISLINRG